MRQIVWGLLFLSSCKSKNSQADCSLIDFKGIYADHYSTPWDSGYLHYLYSEKYSDDCFARINFSNIAYKYADTCKTNLPVRVIYFVDGVSEITPESDMTAVQGKAIIAFSLKKGKITKVHFQRNGKIKTIDIRDTTLKEESWF